MPRLAPDKALGCRISGDELMPGGLSAEDAKAFVKLFADAGANFFNVSQGCYENLGAGFAPDGENEFTLPLVVLIDGGSASASEILAGAIKDYKIGTLVGTTTYGKGIVQKIFSYEDGSAVKITVSKYYTPNGYNIHGVGIEPDVIVEFDGDLYLEVDIDNQLQKAIEIISEEIE